ncbi:MAG TPA: ATP-binding cassette domain-containing protein, partial [Dongiaceae bacterium]|nr:ATP-binding cassette domain-containing protein [Dongiaceae bacterium]
GAIRALKGINLTVRAGEVTCVLGDNGAGKSTLIKIISGLHPHNEGVLKVDGAEVHFGSPRAALDHGIATVYQDLAMVPLMSITRNFFMGRELVRGWGPFSRFDIARADAIVVKQLAQIGIDLRDPAQAVGTLSGGERQCVAIARAVYFGARVLILDEPTSALGVHQAAIVLKYVAQARQRGLGVVFISHNIHHAYVVADRFTLLNRGASKGTFRRADISRDEVLQAMAGGEDMQRIEAEISSIGGAASASG